MAVPAINPFQQINPNFVGLQEGQRKNPKTDRGIYARLIAGELVEGAGGWSFTALAELYNRGAKQPAIAALKTALGVLGVPPTAVDAMASTFGGYDAFFDAADNIGTLGLVPDRNFLYIFEDDDLGIPAGMYSTNSVYQNKDKFYSVKAKNEWIGVVDFILGVPNLSWLGEWQTTTRPESNNPLMIDHERITPKYVSPDGVTPGTGASGGDTTDKPINLLPLAFSGVGYAMGGIPGAAFGFTIGTALSGD